MGLLGRTQDLHLYGPSPLIDIFNLQLKVADTNLPFKLNFHPLTEEGIILKENRYQVSCFQVYHRIECWGFIFRQIRPPRRVNPDKARIAGVPSAFFDRLKWGEDYENQQGLIIPNATVTDAAPNPRSYAYSADTVYNPELASKVKYVDMLYHETTYLKDLEERATKRYHCTTVQAGNIAKTAGVKQLLIGHFSSKYDKLDDFEKETREVFPSSFLALEGVSYIVQ
jgi:ribonuclease Z